MKLALVVDAKVKAEFDLGLGSNLIGRWDPDTKSFPEVDLEEFDLDSLVSRRHAIIVLKDNIAVLEDLGSTNGTFLVGGEKLEPGNTVTIDCGGEFFVGNLRMKLLV